jgi:LysM repeat protein
LRDLRAWNGLVSSRIYPGDKLTLHTDGSSVSATYTVRRGDTLGRIAQRFGVTVAKLCAWNGIATNTTLFPGNRLVIGDTVSPGQ